MSHAELLQTGRVAAEATVRRLAALEIDAEVLDEPNVFTKLTSGGNYRVRVVVAEEDLERARTELARWEGESAPRVEALAREALVVWLLLRSNKQTSLWIATIPAWLVGLMSWAFWSRRRNRKTAPPNVLTEESAHPARPLGE